MAKEIEWQGEEYIKRDKNVWWYVGLIAVIGGLAAVAVVFRWWTFLVLIVLVLIVVLMRNFRPAAKIHYKLDKDGLTEGKQLYKFEDFKAFGILKEGTHFSAILMPKKRFGMQVKVYFPEKNGEEIVDALGARLPMEEVKLDFLDKLVNFLRI